MTNVIKVRKYLLSIDGGGFRGLAGLVILNRIMQMLVEDQAEDPVPAPCEVFDLIGGTSTGGLIATLLGRLGLDCLTAFGAYRELCTSLLGKNGEIKWEQIEKGEGFPSANFETKLASIVEKYAGDKDALLKPPRKRPDTVNHKSADTFVTIVESSAGAGGVEAYRLRSYPTPGRGIDTPPIDHKWTICEAVRGVSASPLYLAPLKVESYIFQDAAASGFGNPVLETMAEAALLWPNKPGVVHEFVVVSLGTGLGSLFPSGFSKLGGNNADEESCKELSERFWGKAKTNVPGAKRWLAEVAKQLVAVATDTQLAHSEALRRFRKMKRRDDYFRFDPSQGLGDIDISDHTQEGNIIALTNAWMWSGYDSMHDACDKLKERRRNGLSTSSVD